MKETDYIRATNLARLRMAEQILRQVMAQNPVEQEHLNAVVNGTFKLVAIYEAKVDAK